MCLFDLKACDENAVTLNKFMYGECLLLCTFLTVPLVTQPYISCNDHCMTESLQQFFYLAAGTTVDYEWTVCEKSFFIPRATFSPCAQCEEGTSEVDGNGKTGCKIGWALWPVHRAMERHQCVYAHRLDRWARLVCVPAGHGQSQSMLPAERQRDKIKSQRSRLLMRVRLPQAQSRRQHCAESQLLLSPSLWEKFLKDYWAAHTIDRIILTGLLCVSDSRNWGDTFWDGEGVIKSEHYLLFIKYNVEATSL